MESDDEMVHLSSIKRQTTTNKQKHQTERELKLILAGDDNTRKLIPNTAQGQRFKSGATKVKRTFEWKSQWGSNNLLSEIFESRRMARRKVDGIGSNRMFIGRGIVISGGGVLMQVVQSASYNMHRAGGTRSPSRRRGVN
ncbi:hypothetical protein KM043_010799 [Ampulex compressa]|nr:hypothetical protein KM043_010799 [Ampulex compressa]